MKVLTLCLVASALVTACGGAQESAIQSDGVTRPPVALVLNGASARRLDETLAAAGVAALPTSGPGETIVRKVTGIDCSRHVIIGSGLQHECNIDIQGPTAGDAGIARPAQSLVLNGAEAATVSRLLEEAGVPRLSAIESVSWTAGQTTCTFDAARQASYECQIVLP